MRVEYPTALLLYGVLIAAYFIRRRYYKRVQLKFPEAGSLRSLEDTKTKIIAQALTWLRWAILALIILALANPQKINTTQKQYAQGIDIVLLIDISGSMQAEDLKPNRLAVAKKTIAAFIKKRDQDRVGMVVFGDDAFTRAPLTVDHELVVRFMNSLTIGMAGEGTAIGQAIAVGVNRMRKSNSKSKVMVLLTDGESNSGQIEPITAANLAKEKGIKLYVIGIGKLSGSRIPYQHPKLGRQYVRNLDGSYVKTYLNETPLKEIARVTGGQYFRAVDTNSLEAIYNDINTLEKTKRSISSYTDLIDYFPVLIAFVLALLLIEIALKTIYLGTVP